MKILITGGAGYIGSITNAIMKQRGYETVIFDSLVTGKKESVGNSDFIWGNLTHKEDVETVFSKHTFDAVIHFAALSLAPDSMKRPYDYFVNNIVGGLNLLDVMRRHNCSRFIFSSTCAVYGHPNSLPVTEETVIHPESVYGSSKRMFEEIIEWYGSLYKLQSVILRYFNAAGAMLDGSIGEQHDPESHIIPIALDVAAGKKTAFDIFGDDYETKDGTCIRDYIHVVDLADAHIRALDYLIKTSTSNIFNLGVGKGYTNKEVVNTVAKVTGKPMKIEIKPRRLGDPASIYADNTKAKQILGWTPKYSDLETIIESAWKWHQQFNSAS